MGIEPIYIFNMCGALKIASPPSTMLRNREGCYTHELMRVIKITRECLLLISSKNISSINLLLYIVQTCIVPIGYNCLTLKLENV